MRSLSMTCRKSQKPSSNGDPEHANQKLKASKESSSRKRKPPKGKKHRTSFVNENYLSTFLNNGKPNASLEASSMPKCSESYNKFTEENSAPTCIICCK
jgi:hypothetical protein